MVVEEKDLELWSETAMSGIPDQDQSRFPKNYWVSQI